MLKQVKLCLIFDTRNLSFFFTKPLVEFTEFINNKKYHKQRCSVNHNIKIESPHKALLVHSHLTKKVHLLLILILWVCCLLTVKHLVMSVRYKLYSFPFCHKIITSPAWQLVWGVWFSPNVWSCVLCPNIFTLVLSVQRTLFPESLT